MVSWKCLVILHVLLIHNNIKKYQKLICISNTNTILDVSLIHICYGICTQHNLPNFPNNYQINNNITILLLSGGTLIACSRNFLRSLKSIDLNRWTEMRQLIDIMTLTDTKLGISTLQSWSPTDCDHWL